MSDPELRFLYEIDEDEYRQDLGQHVQAMLDDADKRQQHKGEQARSFLDDIHRARLAREAEHGGS